MKQITHKIENFVGFRKRGVNMMKIDVANKAREASKRPPKMSRRSQRLTARCDS